MYNVVDGAKALRGCNQAHWPNTACEKDWSMRNYGLSLKKRLDDGDILPFIGIYDTFSAGVAGRHF